MSERWMNSKRVRVIIALALFNYIFLGTEYLSDNRMAYVTDAGGVVTAQSYILGASAVGFLLFSVLNRLVNTKISYGLIVFVLLGIAGSAVHYYTFIILKEKQGLGMTVGVSYAVGLLLQFINNNAVNHDTLEAVVLSAALMVWVVLLVRLRFDVVEDVFYGEQEERTVVLDDNAVLAHPAAAAVSLIVCVICMTCIFATLDNVVTLYHADGNMDIGQWPRLLLAVSGLLAGFLFDLADYRYMNIIMYCVTLLSVICVLVILSRGSFLIGLIVFYLSAGFFVLFFTVGFMRLSYHMRFPEFWARLGRGVNNICAGMIAATSLTIFETGNSMLISIIALVLFVLISVAMFIYAGQLEVHPTSESEIKEDVEEMDFEQRFFKFSKAYVLTPREQDVLKILLTSDDSVQNLAEQLFISRAALYRHISALNEKTGTKSRIGLLQFYYGWEENNE